jgi:hypothetical protein
MSLDRKHSKPATLLNIDRQSWLLWELKPGVL